MHKRACQLELIKIGVVWNLYVAPEYRERGVEAKLLERVVGRWKETGCTKGFASALCDDDAAVLARLGFTPQNAMVVELDTGRGQKLRRIFHRV